VQDFTFRGEKLFVPQAVGAAVVVAHEDPAGQGMQDVCAAKF
jgi:hypothetical protein